MFRLKREKRRGEMIFALPLPFNKSAFVRAPDLSLSLEKKERARARSLFLLSIYLFSRVLLFIADRLCPTASLSL